MAWNRNDLSLRVITYPGTDVNQQWPGDPATPGGAADFHTALIP